MNTSYLEVSPYKWVRSNDGIIAGVCEGLGRRFGIDPWIVRIIWLASILALGTGLLVYFVMAFALPREDQLATAYDKRVLGVCARISQKTGIEVGLVRAASVLLALASFGATIIGYVVLYFVLADREGGPIVPV